jgi:hypothetical protein
MEYARMQAETAWPILEGCSNIYLNILKTGMYTSVNLDGLQRDVQNWSLWTYLFNHLF